MAKSPKSSVKTKDAKSAAKGVCSACEGGDRAGIQYPDHSGDLGRLRRVQGQLRGIEKMILDRRYCVDILLQFKAIQAALASLQQSVLERHLAACVNDVLEARDSSGTQEKIRELLELVRKVQS